MLYFTNTHSIFNTMPIYGPIYVSTYKLYYIVNIIGAYHIYLMKNYFQTS